ncbi:MAG TPA: DUF3536 domain-containing protein, partial [Pyrinomonadaceae bacterium]|nr:DUF3536 domain-containing protein [Pyrinomonadaceae bacterium]
AVAQGFHHAILPLCNERDRRTEIRWGVADFRHRFGRDPESLWLPETACDAATLCALIEEGLRYVILSPFQAARVRPLAGGEWLDVRGGKVDATMPYLFRHPEDSGRSIAVFFYDGEAARAVAFERALVSSRGLVFNFERAARRGGGNLVNVATDGESYGHHFRYGDLCLAHTLEEEAARHGFRLTNYGEFLDENPPAWEVELVTWNVDEDDAREDTPELTPGATSEAAAEAATEGTAWSCAHGLGRWSRDCGCNAGAPAGWNQKWRAPLRDALNFLRDASAAVFEERGGELLRDPWRARDRYVELLLDPSRAPTEFLSEQAGRSLSHGEQSLALKLLEMQRGSLMTFTSCGWFFDDITGIETVQVLRYAARTLELLEDCGADAPREEFLERLAEARSNVRGAGNGADVFRARAGAAGENARQAARDEGARPLAVDAAGYALLRVVGADPSRETLDFAAEVLAELRSLDARNLRQRARGRVEELLRRAVAEADESRPEDAVEAVASLVRLASALGFENFFERAQEVVYEAINGAGEAGAGRLSALGLSLKLSPALFGPAVEPPPPGGEGANAPALL